MLGDHQADIVTQLTGAVRAVHRGPAAASSPRSPT